MRLKYFKINKAGETNEIDPLIIKMCADHIINTNTTKYY